MRKGRPGRSCLLPLASCLLPASCLLLASCAGNRATVAVASAEEVTATIEAERFDAAVVKVEELKTTVAAMQTTIGELSIGGGGDSVTAWIYALIVGSVVFSSTFYPLIVRPLRRGREKRRNAETQKRGNAETHRQYERWLRAPNTVRRPGGSGQARSSSTWSVTVIEFSRR